MGKGRMTVLDLVATTKELRKALIGTRLANIYDINAKTFLFKFARSDEKLFLLMESGIRVHLTKYSREKGDMPNGFNMKLRKHIRTKLVHDVQQMAGDRVIFFTFGTGENAFHVILELYAAGNVILADHEFSILSLLRPYELETDGVRVAVGERYPVQLGGMQFAPIDAPSLAAWWSKALENPKNKVIADIFPPGSPFSPMVIDHCLMRAAFDPKTPLRSVWDGAGAFARCDEMVAALAPATALLQTISTQLPMKGVLVVQPPAKDKVKSAAAIAAAASSADAGASASATETDVNYSEFVPFLFANFERQQTREFDSFNEAIDEFFTRVESSKETSRIAAQEAAAWSKVERIKEDHEQRIAQLEQQQATVELKARLIAHHAPMVDQAMLAVRQALAAGMDWNALVALIREERRQGNPVAAWIRELKLAENKISLAIPNSLPEEEGDYEESDDSDDDDSDEDDDEEDDEEDEEDEDDVDVDVKTLNKKQRRAKAQADHAKSKGKAASGAAKVKPPFVNVDVDLSLTAMKNSEACFSVKKRSADKQQRTAAATSKALKHAEITTRKTLASLEKQQRIAKLRKIYWFEKFHWFITSENFLVVGGKDAQQNETLVKRYLKKHDVYIHADIHGASSVVVKNHGEGPIPPLSLQQAALMTIARSSAWEAKVLTTAYWVNAHQVSKTAPTGEYLTTGSFMIRGKRNMIPPAPLVMGLGILVKLDPSSMAHHVGERRVRGFGTEAESSAAGAAADGSDAGALAAGGIESDGDDSDNDNGQSNATAAVSAATANASSLDESRIESTDKVAAAIVDAGENDDSDDSVEDEKQDEDDSDDDEATSSGFDVTTALFASAAAMPSVFNIGLFAKSASSTSAPALAAAGATATAPAAPAVSIATSAAMTNKERFADAIGSVTRGTAQERAEARVMLTAGAATWNPDGADVGEAADDGDDPFRAKANAPNNRRRLTAAERRRQKKPQSQEQSQPHAEVVGAESENDDDEEDEDGKAKPQSKSSGRPSGQPTAAAAATKGGKSATSAPPPPPPSLASLPRGKRAKMKRLRGKYQEQDDDERELVSQMLGTKIAGGRSGKRGGGDESDSGSSDSDDGKAGKAAAKSGKAGGRPAAAGGKPAAAAAAGKKKGGASSAAAAAAAPEASDAAAATSEFATKSCFICLEKGHVSRDCPRKPADKSVKEVITEAKQREEAEISRILADENIAFVADEDKAALNELDSLTGRPLPSDILHFGVPVCAPWAALTDYKYKVKLVPGTSKRGQVTKGSMFAFLHHEEINERERELIKLIPDNDIFSVLLSNVKVASALARSGTKKDKKKGKK